MRGFKKMNLKNKNVRILSICQTIEMKTCPRLLDTVFHTCLRAN